MTKRIRVTKTFSSHSFHHLTIDNLKADGTWKLGGLTVCGVSNRGAQSCGFGKVTDSAAEALASAVASAKNHAGGDLRYCRNCSTEWLQHY